MTIDRTRRRAVRLCGLALAGGLAGCTGSGDGDDGGGDGGGETTTAETTGATDTTTATETTAGTTTTATGGPATPSGIEDDPLPDSGDDALLSAVETEKAESTAHVERGEDIDYGTVPPTGGPHYTGTVEAGFYRSEQSLGDLVHTLEHGAVIIYYDPDRITPSARASLQAFADAHPDFWKRVVVVPDPREDPPAPYVLTAWEKRLRMDEYDPEVVRAFLAEYLGRGPEKPVR